MKECNAVGKKNGFKTMEMLEAVILDPEEWTPENGLTTAAQKIQRKKIADHFRKEIDVRFPSLSFTLTPPELPCSFLSSYRRYTRTSEGLSRYGVSWRPLVKRSSLDCGCDTLPVSSLLSLLISFVLVVIS